MHITTRDGSTDPISIAQSNGSLYIAIVVTLGSITLLIFSFRLYTCAKLRRNFGIDDWTALLAAFSIIGVIVTFATLASNDFWNSSWDSYLSWYSALNLLHVLGMGFIKISITLFFIRVVTRRYCRYMLFACLVVLAILTIEWFIVVLVRYMPATIMPTSTYANLDFLNNLINSITSVLLAILLLICICDKSLTTLIRLCLASTLCLGITSCIAAIFRMIVVCNEWQTGQYYDQNDIMFTIWSVVELTSALTASSVPLAGSFARAFPPPTNNNCAHEPSSPHPSHTPSSTSTTTTTITATATSPRPQSVRLSSLIRHSLLSPIEQAKGSFSANRTRYHDELSNLDFDIAGNSPVTPTSTTPTTPGGGGSGGVGGGVGTPGSRGGITARTTLQTRVTSSETVSGWSQFSGFTYYMTPVEQRDRASRTLLANTNATTNAVVSSSPSDVDPGVGAVVGLAMMEQGQPSPLESVRETETPSAGGEGESMKKSSSRSSRSGDEGEKDSGEVDSEDGINGMVCAEAAERESALPIGHAI